MTTRHFMTTLGIISDTHGLMRPEALSALRDCELILHAGDIGSPEVLDELESIAKVKAIRGNNDDDPWADHLPTTLRLRAEGASIYMLHDVKELEIDPEAKKIAVVISGHSHRPSVAMRNGVLFLNPGSAGPRRFKLPITVAKLTICGSTARAKVVQLEV